MILRYRLVTALAFVGIFLTVAAAYPQEKFKLKPGANGKICITCHSTFQEKLRSPFLHTPVKKGECTGCHNPHATRHAKLLSTESAKVCYTCHGKIIPEKSRSVHKVVAEGKCTSCHDPHGAGSKFNLLKPGSELCFTCHKNIATKVNARFKHSPVQAGCTSCHDPHGSAKGMHLLKEDDPGLCTQCHKTDKPSFVQRHMNYPVQRGHCTNCHDAHGSDSPVLLYANIHHPVANKMCNQCHEEPSSPNALGLKKSGFELCRGCHSKTVNDIFGKTQTHWPVFGKKGCLNCHSAHASMEKPLLRGTLPDLCGKCHADTVEKLGKSLVKHQPIKEGNCTACHAAHAGEGNYLLKQPSVIDLCGSCHDWQKHTTHPIGKIKDPRSKNIAVDCLSCHRSHGTPFKNMLYMELQTELCTQCHEKYTR